jgi:restriction system protein
VWRKTIYHPELKASRVLRGETHEEIERKAQLQMEQWAEKWQRIQVAEARRQGSEKAARLSSQKKDLASRRTRDAQQALTALGNILKDGIEVDHVLDWDSLKSRAPFSKPRPGGPGPDFSAAFTKKSFVPTDTEFLGQADSFTPHAQNGGGSGKIIIG